MQFQHESDFCPIRTSPGQRGPRADRVIDVHSRIAAGADVEQSVIDDVDRYRREVIDLFKTDIAPRTPAGRPVPPSRSGACCSARGRENRSVHRSRCRARADPSGILHLPPVVTLTVTVVTAGGDLLIRFCHAGQTVGLFVVCLPQVGAEDLVLNVPGRDAVLDQGAAYFVHERDRAA